MADDTDVGRRSESTIQTLIHRANQQSGEPGLDLICTKIAVDFQSIDEVNAAERLASGLKDLTDAGGLDSSFTGLLAKDGSPLEGSENGTFTYTAVGGIEEQIRPHMRRS